MTEQQPTSSWSEFWKALIFFAIVGGILCWMEMNTVRHPPGYIPPKNPFIEGNPIH